VTPTIEWFTGPRDALADLFAEADDSPEGVSTYRDLGRVLVAREGPRVIGYAQLVEGDRVHEAEVKSIAVREDRRGEGIGRMLIERIAAECRQDQRSTLLVATAAADTRALRFYQLSGFRMLRVERDVFTPEGGYRDIAIEGIPLRDRVWLSLAL
jgi:ribosomal protein S18 acetylase RimI-like enzyme